MQAYSEGVAKGLVDRIYGPQGLPWGTKVSELEDVVIGVREVLSEKMLAQALERQAQTARPFLEGWSIYVQWIGWVWRGEVPQVIAALAQRQLELGKPEEADGETSPRQIAAQALTYLQNMLA